MPRAVVLALIVTLLACMSCDNTPSRPAASTKAESLNIAKAADRAFHAACDEWARADAEGRDVMKAQGELSVAYSDFTKHAEQAGYDANEAYLLPYQLSYAGGFPPTDGEPGWSFLIGKGQTGVIVTMWNRTGFADDRLPGHGIDASLGIEPRSLLDKFSVGRGRWVDEKREVMHVPYTIARTADMTEVSGTIELRRTGQKWEIRTDRGTMTGNWWRPLFTPVTQPGLQP